MTLTKIVVVLAVALLGLLCWLAAMGMGAAREGLISFFALAALVAGGNLLSGRGGHYGAGARSSAPVPASPGAAVPIEAELHGAGGAGPGAGDHAPEVGEPEPTGRDEPTP